MRVLTPEECRAWLLSECGIEVHNPYGYARPEDGKSILSCPRESGRKIALARELVCWMGPFSSALLWITDWPFAGTDEMAIVAALRGSHGHRTPLIEAPGHVFESSEHEEFAGWIALTLWFEWDAHVFQSPFSGTVLHTSHHDEVWITSSRKEPLAELDIAARRLDLSVR